MYVKKRKNGNLYIILGVNEEVTIRAASVDVQLETADNTYTLPKHSHDYDECSVTGKRRESADYPPNL